MAMMIRHKVAPGPRGNWLFGCLKELRRDPIGTFQEAAKQYGDVVRLRFGPRVLYFLNHPDHIQYILQTNQKNYSKETRGWKKMASFLGPSVFTTSGEIWRRQRRMMQPMFTPQKISGFVDVMARAVDRMIGDWSKIAEAKKALDIREEMMKITLRIIGDTMMSTDVSGKTDKVGAALTVLLHHINDRYTRILDWPLWIPLPQNLRFRRAKRTLDKMVLQIIAQRRGRPNDREDLLSWLMKAQDEQSGEGMDDFELRDQVLTIFLAGHETTANALAWTWYLVSRHPPIEERLREEATRVLQGRPPTLSDIPKLGFTTRVFEEALRLYPPVWVFSRRAEEKDDIGGYSIPAKAIVFFSPYLIHHDPAYWEDPESFNPDRFFESNPRTRHVYLPFGEGPRQCMGSNFAMMESPLIIAFIAQRYRLRLEKDFQVTPEFSVTLRPRNGIRMLLEKI